MSNFPLWADRLFNTPVALAQHKNDTLCEFAEMRLMGAAKLPDRIGSAQLEGIQMRAMSDEASFYSDEGRKPFLFRGNVAVIPVRGTLVSRASYIDAESGLVGYNRVIQQARAAMDDREIKGIFMPVDSGGGECARMLATAEELAGMAKAEGGKPIYVYLDEQACSAAYVLASAGDKVLGRRESIGGSIAALMNMTDKSKAYEKMGLETYVIRAKWADRKSVGTGGEKFDSPLIEKMSALVDEMSDQIAEFVAAMRGIPIKAIKSLRGEIFTGTDMIKYGLLDDIVSEQEAWAMLEQEIANS
jgi:capsid assembly protease